MVPCAAAQEREAECRACPLCYCAVRCVCAPLCPHPHDVDETPTESDRTREWECPARARGPCVPGKEYRVRSIGRVDERKEMAAAATNAKSTSAAPT